MSALIVCSNYASLRRYAYNTGLVHDFDKMVTVVMRCKRVSPTFAARLLVERARRVGWPRQLTG